MNDFELPDHCDSLPQLRGQMFDSPESNKHAEDDFEYDPLWVDPDEFGIYDSYYGVFAEPEPDEEEDLDSYERFLIAHGYYG